MGPESDVVTGNAPAEISLHFRVAEGLHVNSHEPREKFLQPTRLAVLEDGEVTVGKVDFPPGEDYAFSFDPTNKLSVYSGDFSLVAHVMAKPGEHTLHAVLHYQACDHAACYPPKNLDFDVLIDAKR